jgi:cation diffusion facilitator family transporter
MTTRVHSVSSPVTPEDTRPAHAERRTHAAIALVTAGLLIEVIGGTLSGSLALVADAVHLAGDLGVLLFSSLAYWFARTRAQSRHFTFGTGKVQVLAGYTNGVLLTGLSLGMMGEAIARLWHPSPINYAEAMTVTACGLAISLGNAFLLGSEGHHHHHHDHRHDHDEHEHVDHTWRSVYLHVLSDVVTGALTLVALFLCSEGAPVILDALVALGASLFVLRWGVRLCRDTAWPLLDAAAGPAPEIRRRLESLAGVEVQDLRVWSLGTCRYGCLAVLSRTDARPVQFFRDMLGDIPHISHLFIGITDEPQVPASPSRPVAHCVNEWDAA